MNNSNEYSQFSYGNRFWPPSQIYMPQTSPNFYNQFPAQQYNNYSNLSTVPQILQHNFITYQRPFNIPQFQPNTNYFSDNNIENHYIPTTIHKQFKEESECKVKKNRRDRTTYTKFQLQELENYFIINSYPDVMVRETISRKLGIGEMNIQVWFKNRRAKKRRLSAAIKEKLLSNIDDNKLNTSDKSNLNVSDNGKEMNYNARDINNISLETNTKLEQSYDVQYTDNNNNNVNTNESNYEFLPNLNFMHYQYQNSSENVENYLPPLNAYKPEPI